MSEQNKSTIRRIVEEVWNKKNSALIDETIADNYIGHTPDGTLQGPAGYRQLHNTYAKAFPDCAISIKDLIAEGDKVVCQYSFRGKHQGDLTGIPPTGRHVTVEGTVIVRFAGGKIVEETSIWDTLSLMTQLGVVSLPSQAKARGAGR